MVLLLLANHSDDNQMQSVLARTITLKLPLLELCICRMGLHEHILLQTQTYFVTEIQNLSFFFFKGAICKLLQGPLTAYRCINPLITIILWGVLNRQLMKKIAVIPASLHHECEDLEKKIMEVVRGNDFFF